MNKGPDLEKYSQFSLECILLWQQRYKLIQMLSMVTVLFVIMRLMAEHFQQSLWHDWGIVLFWVILIWLMMIDASDFWSSDSRYESWNHWLPLSTQSLMIVRTKWNCFVFSRQCVILLLLPCWFFMFQFDLSCFWTLLGLILMCLPIVFSLCLLMASLSTVFREGSMLLVLVILPLLIPLVLYGASAIFAVQLGQSAMHQLLGCLGLGLLSWYWTPKLIRLALKAGVLAQ